MALTTVEGAARGDVMGPIRTYIVWATPSWRISAFVWVLAFGFYLMLPFWVDGWELFRCADGYSNVRVAQIWVPIFAARGASLSDLACGTPPLRRSGSSMAGHGRDCVPRVRCHRQRGPRIRRARRGIRTHRRRWWRRLLITSWSNATRCRHSKDPRADNDQRRTVAQGAELGTVTRVPVPNARSSLTTQRPCAERSSYRSGAPSTGIALGRR